MKTPCAPPPAAATIWFDDELEDIEYVVQQTMKRAYEALDAKGSGVFDARRHCVR